MLEAGSEMIPFTQHYSPNIPKHARRLQKLLYMQTEAQQ